MALVVVALAVTALVANPWVMITGGAVVAMSE